LDANKNKRKHNKESQNCAGNTYTLVSTNRASLPVAPSTTLLNDKSENNVTQNNTGNKLSLDSQNIDNLEEKKFKKLLDQVHFFDPKLRKLLEMNFSFLLEDKTLTPKKPENNTIDQLSTQNNQQTGIYIIIRLIMIFSFSYNLSIAYLNISYFE
jgi:hypothetical protein